MVLVDEWRECRECNNRCPLDRWHFQPTHIRKSDGEQSYRRKCRVCESRKATDRDKQYRNDPNRREAYLAHRRAANARYLETHPDKAAQFATAKKEANRIALPRARRELTPEERRAAARKQRERYHKRKARESKRNREAYYRRRNDPVAWARYLEVQRRWIAENRERVNANRQRWYAANAERLNEAKRQWHQENRDRVNDERRINRRLQAEREGRTMRLGKSIPQPRESLPVAPVASYIERLAHAYGSSEVAELAGVDGKTIRHILSREGDISFNTADTLCVRLGFNLFDFWPEYV
jgi:hypothetical protein